MSRLKFFCIALLVFLSQKQSSFKNSENHTVPVYWSFVFVLAVEPVLMEQM